MTSDDFKLFHNKMISRSNFCSKRKHHCIFKTYSNLIVAKNIMIIWIDNTWAIGSNTCTYPAMLCGFLMETSLYKERGDKQISKLRKFRSSSFKVSPSYAYIITSLLVSSQLIFPRNERFLRVGELLRANTYCALTARNWRIIFGEEPLLRVSILTW